MVLRSGKVEHYRRVAKDTYTLNETEFREALADYIEKHAGVRVPIAGADITGFSTGGNRLNPNPPMLKGLNELSVTVDAP